MLIDARIPTIATTISSSMSVKPRQQRVRMCIPSNDKGGALPDTTLDYVAPVALLNWRGRGENRRCGEGRAGVVLENRRALVGAERALARRSDARGMRFGEVVGHRRCRRTVTRGRGRYHHRPGRRPRANVDDVAALGDAAGLQI